MINSKFNVMYFYHNLKNKYQEKYKGQDRVTGIEFILSMKILRNQKHIWNDSFQILDRQLPKVNSKRKETN